MPQLGQHLVLLANLYFCLANPLAREAQPTVRLDSATVTGKTTGVVSEFLGIPYAQPPVGNRRFRLPEPLPPYTSDILAQEFGRSCPGQGSDAPPPEDGLSARAGEPEDCLTINVVAPGNTTSKSKLPVVVWIYGGAFAAGATSQYDGGAIVRRSLELSQPVIYVSMNYRVTAFGFLAGKEAKAAGAGNLGLQDQRLALRWIKKYISSFGGDPAKVTIWGESAGAMSVAFQMVANGGNTEGLFRGGFMQSGATLPLNDMTYGQKYYDSIVRDSGCANSTSTLECLRRADFNTLKAAIDNTPGLNSYQAGILAWLPRVDGVFLKDDPQKLVQRGSVAKIPFVNGNCDDEGTLFSFTTLNITTDADFQGWLRQFWFPTISNTEMAKLLELYPSDVTKGSPYDTGTSNALTPQFKRIASFQGDSIFQAPRRNFLEYTASKQPTWSYIYKRGKATQFVGAAHASDISNVFGPGDITDYLIHFTNTLDPNGSGITPWPKYTLGNRVLLRFTDDAIQRDTQLDDYRTTEIKYLTKLLLAHPIL